MPAESTETKAELSRDGQWSHTLAGQRKNSRKGWIILLVVMIALPFGFWQMHRSFMDFRTLSLQTYSCSEPVTGAPGSDALATWGCTPSAGEGVDVMFRQSLSEIELTQRDGGTLTYEDAPAASPELNLVVESSQPIQGVALGDTGTGGAVDLMNGDAAMQRFTGHLGSTSSDTIMILVGPPGG